MITKLKKNPKEYEELTQEFFEKTKEKKCEPALCKYTWDVLIAMNRGYGFNASHTLAYSIVGLQEMNLARFYPILFWDTANLIVDSGAMNLTEKSLEEEDIEEDNENEEIEYENNFFEENIIEEDEEEKKTNKKVKNSSADYGRIAAAIGKMKARGLKLSLPDINKSKITFRPNLENQTILYGLRGLTKVGNQILKETFANRPYTSIEDFMTKVKVNKTQMISLIKAGVFDNLYNGNREEIMNHYLTLIADQKKRITLQNMQMLIAKNMIPEELDFEKRLFNFNKYLKKNKDGDYYFLDTIAMRFYNENYEDKYLENLMIIGEEQTAKIKQTTWDKFYKAEMEPVRKWMKANQEKILNNLNQNLFDETKEKYASGNISKWEMDSLSFYYHPHELANLKNTVYDIVDYFNLSNEPEVDKTFPAKDGGIITMYKIHRIAGTVIDKDKNKSEVKLLTTSGVVTVKVWKNQFAKWDKQISEKGADGKKHVIEKSFFTRGTKLIITGIRRDDTFIPKKYKNTEYPVFERIDKLDDKGQFIIQSVSKRADDTDED